MTLARRAVREGRLRSVGRVGVAGLAALVLLGAAAGVTLAAAGERSPGVARLGWLEGDVSTLRAGAGEWANGEINDVLVAGDRVADGPGSRVEIETARGLHLWLGAASDLEIVGLDDAAAQFRLTQGTLVVARRGGTARAVAGSSGGVAPLEILLPAGTLTLSPDAVVRLDVSAGGTTIAQVRSGRVAADVAGRRATLDAPGSWRLEGQGSLAEIRRVDDPPDDEMDVWAAARRERFAEVASAAHVNADIEGIADLDDAGVWDESPEYGWIWRPTVVSVGWAPYAVGRWAWREPWGWTWIDDAGWGWAPFHYGRWVRSSGAWWWAPGPLVAAPPVWAPALVGFTWATPGVTVSVGVGTPWIGWVPLGWGEPCLPWWTTGGVAIGSPWWGGWYGPQVVNNIIIAPGRGHHGHGPHGHRGDGHEGPGRGGHGDDGSPGGRPHPGGPGGSGGGGQTADRSPLPGGGGDPGAQRGDGRLPQRVRWAHEQAGAVAGAPADQLDRGSFRRAVLRADSSSPGVARAPINPRSQARVETARLPVPARGASPIAASYEARRQTLGDPRPSLRGGGREVVSPLAPAVQPQPREAIATTDTARRALGGRPGTSRSGIARAEDPAADGSSRRSVWSPPSRSSSRRSSPSSPWSSREAVPSGTGQEAARDSSPPPSSRSAATWSAPRSRGSSGSTWNMPRSGGASGSAGNEGSRWTGRSSLGGRGFSSGSVVDAPAPRAPVGESVRSRSSLSGGSAAPAAQRSWASGLGQSAPRSRTTFESNDSGARTSPGYSFGGGDRSGGSGRGSGSGFGAGSSYGAMRSAPSRSAPSTGSAPPSGGRAGIGSR